MTKEQFQKQLLRLQSEWKHSYGPERLDLFWKTFGQEKEDIFESAVTHCIGHSRGAPLIEDLQDAIQQAHARQAQDRISFGFSKASTRTILDQANELNRTADPDFVKLCIKHLDQFQKGKITREAFYSGCDELDKLANKLNPMH